MKEKFLFFHYYRIFYYYYYFTVEKYSSNNIPAYLEYSSTPNLILSR